ncbi:MAG: LytTR family transcriptional regulator [Ruminococcus flavefaciens]|nr:LytTR family transcriptional regulator [Ruminococcus flavefaciens]MCM1363353.1 LytTR family transcriptional regulator [Clostridiales bacterium]
MSAHEELVFKAIEFQPFRYIRKIRLETETLIAIQAAVNVLEISSDKQIILYTEDGEKAVMISEIMYFEAEKYKTYIYLKNGDCIHARRSIAELHQLINKESFIMIHRSCVVNTDYVKNMQNCLLILKNDEQLLVSRRKFSKVKQQILNIWGELL